MVLLLLMREVSASFFTNFGNVIIKSQFMIKFNS